MRLEILNSLTEEKQVNRIIEIMEDLFNGADLDDISDDQENLQNGIRILNDISSGDGDDLSYDDIELASASFRKLVKLLKSSKNGLEEQLKINRLTKK